MAISIIQNLWFVAESWKRDQRGVAAIEFALAVPILLSLFLGGIDILNIMLLHQKAEKVAYTMADLMTQQEQPTRAQVDDFYLAPPQIMAPFPFDTNGIVILTSVSRQEGEAQAMVDWRESGAGTLTRSSQIGPQDQVAVLPGGLTLNERDTVIVAEVYYHYDPLLPVEYLNADDIYKVAVYKARFGSNISPPQ